MKSWGREIWDHKQEKQGSLGVIAGVVETKSFMDKQTLEEMEFLDKNVFPLLKNNAKILDAGIGPIARFSIEFAKRGYNVIGMDFSIKILKEAGKKIKDIKNIKLIEDDLTALKNIKGKFDLIFCFGTFGHIPSFLSLETLKNFNRKTKSKGYCYLHFWMNKEKSLKNILHDFVYEMARYFKRKLGRSFKVNCSFYTEEEIEEMAKLSGFKIIVKNKGCYLLKKSGKDRV